MAREAICAVKRADRGEAPLQRPRWQLSGRFGPRAPPGRPRAQQFRRSDLGADAGNKDAPKASLANILWFVLLGGVEADPVKAPLRGLGLRSP